MIRRVVDFVLANRLLILGMALLLFAWTMSHAIVSDSQRPFAIVIVEGLTAALIMSIFLLPALYVWLASERDVLPAVAGEFGEEEHID